MKKICANCKWYDCIIDNKGQRTGSGICTKHNKVVREINTCESFKAGQYSRETNRHRQQSDSLKIIAWAFIGAGLIFLGWVIVQLVKWAELILFMGG